MRKKIVIFILLIPIIFIACGNNKDNSKEINISVAASLYEPISEIVKNYEVENNIKVNINYGGSGTLKKQISNGAEVALFISADEKYIDELISEGLVLEANKKTPISNNLVVIKSKNAIGDKLAIGEINTVPAGRYAKETLEKLGKWSSIEENVIYCKDVTAVKSYVESGEVDYGIVYKSDATTLENSTVIWEIPNDLHSKITYAIGIVEDTYNKKDIEALVNYILSPEGVKILKEYGFEVEV